MTDTILAQRKMRPEVAAWTRYTITSLAEVLDFNTPLYLQLVRTAERLRCELQPPVTWDDPSELADLVTRYAKHVVRIADQLELNSVSKQATRIVGYLEVGEPASKLEIRIEDLLNGIEDSLADRRAFLLSESEARLYQEDQVSPGVVDSFPSAVFEVQESSRCLALGRYTASVFHCMRALEPAMWSLSVSMGVSDPKQQWNRVLDQIEKKIRERSNSDKEWRATTGRQYQEAATHLRYFKDAWRNHVMHLSREKYDDQRASSILRHTTEFLDQMSPLLSEPSPIGNELPSEQSPSDAGD